MRGKLYGIGVGPGDPELLTLKARRILNTVNCIAVPKTSGEKDSLALSIAQGVIEQETEVLELIFPMSHDAALLAKSRQEAERRLKEKLDAVGDVAFITLGDPTIYSTYMYIHKALAGQGYPVEVVPGVSSFCAAAARAGISLGENKETIAIVPAAYECENLDEILENFDTIILLKAARRFDGLKAKLKAHGLAANAVVVSDCGLAGEKLAMDIERVSGEALSYFTTVLVKKALV